MDSSKSRYDFFCIGRICVIHLVTRSLFYESLSEFRFFDGIVCFNDSKPVLTTILLLISNLIGTYFLVIPLFLIILLLKFRDRLSELPAIIVSLVAVNGFGFSLKTFFHRMRPVFDLVTETGYSFPSMHTYNGVMIYGILILILKRYYPSSWYRNGAIVLFVILMFLTGFSRIYLSVHYTSDVLTGFALGLISLGVLSYFMKKR